MSQEATHIQNAPTSTSKLAIWSLITGILSICCLWIIASIPAIILGIVGLMKINKSGGTLGGKGLSIAGIVTGSVGTVAGMVPIGIIASLIFPAVNGVQHRQLQTQSQAQMQAIYAQLEIHQTDKNQLPATLDELVPKYLPDATSIQCEGPGGKTAPFQYNPNATDGSAILISPFDFFGRRAVIWKNGTVGMILDRPAEAEAP